MTSSIPPEVSAARVVFERTFTELSNLDSATRVYRRGSLYSANDAELAKAAKHAEERLKRSVGDLPYLPFLSELIAFGPKLEAFAKHELETGGAYLFGLAVVRLWSILETFTDDLVLVQLGHRPQARESKVCRSIDVPLADFIGLDEQGRARLLRDRLRLVTKAPLKVGTGRFDPLLDAVGLGGATHVGVRKALLELSEIRNVIVHCGGRADKRLVANCPWLGVADGDELNVAEIQFDLFVYSADWYVLELSRRFAESGGNSQSDTEKALQIQGADLVDTVWKRREESARR